METIERQLRRDSVENHIEMETIERQMPCDSVKSPEKLSENLERFCKDKGFEIESLELRNDMYIIRLRRPKQNGKNNVSSHNPIGRSSINSQMCRKIIWLTPLIYLLALRPQANRVSGNTDSHNGAGNRSTL